MLKKLHRGTVDIKKAQIKRLEMKTTMREVKRVVEQVKSRLDLTEDISLKAFL